jgi:hypothetical protein
VRGALPFGRDAGLRGVDECAHDLRADELKGDAG